MKKIIKRLTICMNEELFLKIRVASAKDDRSMSEWISLVIDKYLEILNRHSEEK